MRKLSTVDRLGEQKEYTHPDNSFWFESDLSKFGKSKKKYDRDKRNKVSNPKRSNAWK